MTKNAFVFPGQGSQYIGMGKDLYETFLVAKRIFNLADEILGFKISDLMFTGNEEELKKTENTQPALFLTSIATLKVLEELSGKSIEQLCDLVAGHSLGEYSALCAAGVFSFEDGLRLVRKRGELMASADPSNKGAMLALIGLDLEKTEKLVQECKSAGIIVIANDNSDGQVVLSGEKPAIMLAQEKSKEFGAKMAVLLPVSGAFHSPLMTKISQDLGDFMQNINFCEAKIPLVSNVEATRVTNPEKIKSLLKTQVYSPVRWRETVVFLEQNGIENMYEIGSKNVLCGLCKRISKIIKPISLEKAEDLRSFSAQ